MTQPRPRALVALGSDIFFRNFIETGAFERLADRLDVHVCSADTVKHELPEGRLVDAGRVRTDERRDHVRYHMRWAAVFAGAHLSGTMAIKRRYSDLGPRGRLLYEVLGLRLVWPLADRLVESWAGLNRSMLDVIDAVKPAVILFPSQGNDSFSLDVMRAAKARGVPTVMLNYNWDNLTGKGPMRLKPDALCVWGEDMAADSRRIHALEARQVRVIGAAHFAQYFDAELMETLRAEAATRDRPRTLLFGGNSRGHAEMPFLESLERAIREGVLPGVKVVYRPHPWRAPRPNEKDFADYGFEHIELDEQLATQFGDGMNREGRPVDRTFTPSMSHNARLLVRVDGVITPLSTLALEAGLVGVPILGMNMFDEEWLRHALTDFDHLQRMRTAVPGVLICDEEEAFIDKVNELLALADDPTLGARMRDAVRPIVYSDGATTYAERLADVAAEVAAEVAA